MKIVKIGLPVLVLILVVIAWLAPIGPLPGFRIGGTETPVPAEWPDTSDLHEIRLSVPGTLPRVVIIWVIDYEGDLYVVGSKDSGWVNMLGNGGMVKMRMSDATYSLTAQAVTTGWEPIMQAYIEKYQADYPDIVAGFPSFEEARNQIAVFRLDG